MCNALPTILHRKEKSPIQYYYILPKLIRESIFSFPYFSFLLTFAFFRATSKQKTSQAQ